MTSNIITASEAETATSVVRNVDMTVVQYNKAKLLQIFEPVN